MLKSPSALGPWLIFTAAALIYALRFATAVPIGVTHDDAEYLVLAESFATGHPYHLISYPEEPLETTWPPGYPLLILTPVYLLVGPQYELLRATSLLLALANIPLLYRFLRSQVAEPYRSVIVALFALNPSVAGNASLAMSETAFLFFMLVFLISFEGWLAGSHPFQLSLLVVVLTLAATVLVRYQGLAVVVASLCYLFQRRKLAWAPPLVLGLLLCLVPFPLFLVSQSVNPRSLFVIQLLTNQAEVTMDPLVSLANYWYAIPHVLLPAIGPKLSTLVRQTDLRWSLELLVAPLLLLLGVGTYKGLRKHSLSTWLLLSYFVLVLFLTNRHGPQVFDEPRYASVMVPFLYLVLLQGMLYVGSRFFRNDEQARLITLGVAGSILVMLVGWNLRHVQRPFAAANLRSGAAWIQEHVAADAVVMTPDPISRYLYFRRKTVNYPHAKDAPAFAARLEKERIDYVIVTPPLTLNNSPNQKRRLGTYIEQVVLPALSSNTRRFRLVFHEASSRTSIYQIAVNPAD